MWWYRFLIWVNVQMMKAAEDQFDHALDLKVKCMDNIVELRRRAKGVKC